MGIKRILVYGLCEEFGGTERYVITLYRAIDRSKLQFDFLYDHAAGKIPYEKEITDLGGRIYREYYKNRDKNLPGAISISELFHRHPEWDGVYVNCQAIDTSYRLIVEAKKAGLEYRVIHGHNNNYTHTPTMKDRLFELYFHLTKQRYVTKYLACSSLAGEWMFKGAPFMVVQNAVDFEKFKYNGNTRKRMRSEHCIDDGTKVIGFCGRLVYQKNPQFILKIFSEVCKKNSDVKLLLVGDGPLRAELENLAEKLGVRNKVIFSGSVSNVEDYVQMMDCFLLPSRFEGFGIVLLEAQAAGLNCFTTKEVVPTSTNLTGHVCFIDADTEPEQWAEEILRIGFEHYDEIDTLLTSDYTVDKSAKKLMEVFGIV